MKLDILVCHSHAQGRSMYNMHGCAQTRSSSNEFTALSIFTKNNYLLV